jgi:hypothetical protein
MKKILVLLLIGLSFGAFAQHRDEADEGKNEKVAALKIAFITERLNLSSKEAELFWPVFNRFEQEMKAVRKKEKHAARIFKDKTTVTEAEADKFIAEQVQLKQQEIDVLKRYLPEFKKVLPASKVARLLSLEQEFKLQLLRSMKQRNNNNK